MTVDPSGATSGNRDEEPIEGLQLDPERWLNEHGDSMFRFALTRVGRPYEYLLVQTSIADGLRVDGSSTVASRAPGVADAPHNVFVLYPLREATAILIANCKSARQFLPGINNLARNEALRRSQTADQASSFRELTLLRAGIPPGRYKVVMAFPSAKGSVSPFQKAFAKYTTVETTPLVLDVPNTGLKDVELKLEEPK